MNTRIITRFGALLLHNAAASPAAPAKRVFAALVFSLTALCAPAFVEVAGSAPSADRPARVPGEILVKMRTGVSPSRLIGKSSMARSASPARISKTGIWRMKTSPAVTEEQAAESLRAEASDLVEYAEPNYIIHAQRVPDDPRFGELYALTSAEGSADIDAPAAWDILTGEAFSIAIVDSGVDYTHEDLAANIWTNSGEIPGNGMDDDGNGFADDVRGWDFFAGDNDPRDEYGHGTHVAGIIGAVGNNGRGVVGVNWKVKMIPLRFMGPDGAGTLGAAVQAIEYATEMGARVISCSWGMGAYSRALEDAIRAADAAGVIVVAAAGNFSSDNDVTPVYPASLSCGNVISVAATDRSGALAWFSCYGAKSVDIAAPGDGILSTMPGNRYELMSGTSMAAPYVSGAAMLAWAHSPSSSNKEIIADILDGAETLASLQGRVATSGRLNLLTMLDPDSVIPSPETDPGVHTVSLALNQGDFAPGEQMILSATLKFSAQSTQPVCDAYLAAALTDGRILFLTAGGRWSSPAKPLAGDIRVTDLEAQIASLTVSSTLPDGAYTWYAVLTSPGASPLQDSSRASNLAQASLTVLP